MNGTVRTYSTPARVCRVSQQQWGSPPQPPSGGNWAQGRPPWQGGNAGWGGHHYVPGPSQAPGPWSNPAGQPSGPGAPYTPGPRPAPGGPWQQQQPPNQGWQQPSPGPWQQAPGSWQAPGGNWPPPPRKRSGFGTLVKVVVAVVGVIFVISMVSPLVSGFRPGGGASPTPGQSNGPVYQNEDYVPPAVSKSPPPIPGPKNLDAAHQLVSDNPLYSQTVPVPTNCKMSNTKPLQQMSPKEKEAHFNEQVGCLMTVWVNPVEKSGFTLPRPPVYVYTSPIKTACGDFDSVNAAYCTADQRIYYSDELLDSLSSEAAQGRYAGELVMAHEFGHAVQARTAILMSERALETDATTKAATQELSRRVEVQADCFAGAYVQSVARSQKLTSADVANLKKVTYTIGDDVLSGKEGYVGGHGTGKARQAWFTRGLKDAQLGVCNTFTAPPDQVR